jgi:glycosyltransferase involved in cell wall biosynthesis
MRVSIIICTRDRAESLRETLASIGQCALPPDVTAELIVVDNGSADATPEVIANTQLANLPLRCVKESAPGLSRARNAGLRATDADVVIFTDDDVRVPADWIEGMCRPIFSGDADAVAGGVHFPPAQEQALSAEPCRSRRGWFASTEGIDPANPTSIVGANMALSRRAIAAVGSFDENLGAGALGFFEETLFIWKLREAGLRLRTAFGTSVAHHFDVARLTRTHLLTTAARMGRSQGYVDAKWHQADPSAATRQLWRARTLLFLHRLTHFPDALARRVTPAELQRVQTAAYWSQLAAEHRD